MISLSSHTVPDIVCDYQVTKTLDLSLGSSKLFIVGAIRGLRKGAKLKEGSVLICEQPM